MVVVCDRRPSMALYPPRLPWLSKPAAVAAVADAIAVSASPRAARSATSISPAAARRSVSPAPPRPSRGDRGAARRRSVRRAGGHVERALAHLARLRSRPAERELRVRRLRLHRADHGGDVARARSLAGTSSRSSSRTRRGSRASRSSTASSCRSPRPGGSRLSQVRIGRARARPAPGQRDAAARPAQRAAKPWARLGARRPSDPLEIDHAFLIWAEQRRQGRRRSR